mgnify:CR=1 FL=1
MSKSLLAAVLAAVFLPLVAPASAQSGAARPDPLDAGVAVKAAPYKSPFAGYRGFVEPEVDSWRDSNDTAGRIGGWRAYAREAAGETPAVVAPAPAATVKPGAMPPQMHHGMHGGAPAAPPAKPSAADKGGSHAH